jgi:hypothetical protein
VFDSIKVHYTLRMRDVGCVQHVAVILELADLGRRDVGVQGTYDC